MGVSIGAIRWDAFHGGGVGSSLSAQWSLGDTKWQFRAPWFATRISSHHIVSQAVQSNMDLELQLAAQAGLKFWAYCWYTPESTSDLMAAWNLHQSSAYKNLMPWCAIVGMGSLMTAVYSNMAAWQAHLNQFVLWFSQSNYLKVFGNRPVLFWLWNTSELASWCGGSMTNLQAVLSYLTTQCATAGLGAPYIVFQGENATTVPLLTSPGGSAISSYIPSWNNGLASAYANLDSAAQSFWTSQVATGAKVIPNGCTGWDTRPRIERPVTWANGSQKAYVGDNTYFVPPMPAQVATHAQNLINFINANPSACETNLGLLYSWTECDEGGKPLIPTLGDLPVNADAGEPLQTSNLLAALGPVLRAAA